MSRRQIPWKGLNNLLSRPARRGMLSHVEMHDAPTLMHQNDKDVEDAKRRRWYGEEVNAGDRFGLIGQKGLP